MSLVPANMDRFDMMERVAKFRMKGDSDTKVAKALGIPRKVVIELFDEYKLMLANDRDARDRAMDLLNLMVEQYDELISDSHKLLEKIQNETFDDKYANQEAKVLGLISDLIAKRLKAVQDAGLLEASDIGDEYAEIEEKANLLISILRNDLCEDCRNRVRDKLAVATNQVEAIIVEDD